MNSHSPNAVELDSLSRSFRTGLGFTSKAVLSDIGLALPGGATLGLIGPNGSGKSTLLRLLAGIDTPTAGSVRVLGGNPLDARVRRRLAYLPEDSPFPRELTPRAVLSLFAALHGLEKRVARKRADDLLDRVGLGSEASTPLRRFSRGMLRRFGLAQAFLSQPELVLLDEPTAGLDAPGFAVLHDLLAEARAGGTTVVLASHLLHDIHEHCEQLLLLIGGRAVSGDVRELLRVEGHIELELNGLDAQRHTALRQFLQEQDVELVAEHPVLRSLGALYAEQSQPKAGD